MKKTIKALQKSKSNSPSKDNNILSKKERADLTQRQIQQAKNLLNTIKNGARKNVFSRKDIQIVAEIDFHSQKSRSYVVFCRTNGEPFLMDSSFNGTALDREKYREIIDMMSLLSTIEYGVMITLYHNYSINDLLKIKSNNWRDYILPQKESYPEISEVEADNTLYNSNITELHARHKVYAVYDGKECEILSSGLEDYVVSISNGKKTKMVDLRDLSSIHKKEFYADIKGKLFEIIGVGKTTVLISYSNYDEAKSLGFKILDSRDFGNSCEVNVSSISSVKYKKKSIYTRILERLKADF